MRSPGLKADVTGAWLDRLIATGMVLPLYMKPHLVAPVMTAAFQNRLLSPEVMELCGKSLNLVAVRRLLNCLLHHDR